MCKIDFPLCIVLLVNCQEVQNTANGLVKFALIIISCYKNSHEPEIPVDRVTGEKLKHFPSFPIANLQVK